MYRSIEKALRGSVLRVREEAKHRAEITPSDVAIEALRFAANEFEATINEALRDTERLTPAQYAELHGVVPQTVTRWIRLGELQAEETGTGYLIARDAVRIERPRQTG